MFTIINHIFIYYYLLDAISRPLIFYILRVRPIYKKLIDNDISSNK